MSANMPMKSFFTFTVISRSRPNCCTGRYIISRLKVCKSFVSIKKHGFQKAWKLCLSLIKYSRMSDREVQFSSLFQTDSKTLHLAPYFVWIEINIFCIHFGINETNDAVNYN